MAINSQIYTLRIKRPFNRFAQHTQIAKMIFDLEFFDASFAHYQMDLFILVFKTLEQCLNTSNDFF
jgi:hypothetical protein